MKLTERQKLLLDFVKAKHGDQKRKYTDVPYWVHVVNVADYVAKYDITLGIETAFCHDLFEDTPCDKPELFKALREFGYSEVESTVICSGVEKLTDIYTPEKYPDLNRKARKKCEAERLRTTSADIHSIKVADLIDNTASILKYDPGFAKTYVPEAIELLAILRKANIYLVMHLSYQLFFYTTISKSKEVISAD